MQVPVENSGEKSFVLPEMEGGQQIHFHYTGTHSSSLARESHGWRCLDRL